MIAIIFVLEMFKIVHDVTELTIVRNVYKILNIVELGRETMHLEIV